MAHTLSPEEYQEIGKSYYKLKQYDKAVEAFTNGIEASVIPAVTLYDYRAASYEKLADFNSAVKDGRLAIRTHKKDVKGYLRTASALQKLNKLDTALNIYKYGMKNVPVEHRDFQLLQQLHDKLTRKLSPPKAIDPFTTLPVELVDMVIGYLSFKNMINCLRVSRVWKNYITNRPKLWANLDLSGATKPVSRAFLGNAVRYSQNTLHTLTVHRVLHTDILRNITTACKNLHTLTILSFPHLISDTLIEMAQCAQNLKHISIHTEISMDTVSQILRRRPDLEMLDAKDVCSYQGGRVDWKGGPFSKLHTVKLQGNISHRLSNDDISFLVQQAPGLKTLTWIKSGKSVQATPLFLEETSLTSLVLTHIAYAPLPRLPSTLKRLVFHPQSVADARIRFNSERAIALSCCSNLTHLSLGEDVTLFPDLLSELLDVYETEDGSRSRIEDGEPLHHLRLQGTLETQNRDNTPSALASTPSSILVSTYLSSSSRILTRALTSLELPGLPLTDDDIDTITESTSLITIDVSHTRISGFGIKKLIDGAPKLRRIQADHCRNLSSRDSIEYARERGVQVNYTMIEPTKGAKGRKVRYG